MSKYLDCVGAVEQADLEVFFGNFIARSRVKDAVNALLAARELSFVHVSGRSMLQITPAKLPVRPCRCHACGKSAAQVNNLGYSFDPMSYAPSHVASLLSRPPCAVSYRTTAPRSRTHILDRGTARRRAERLVNSSQ